MKSVLAPWSYFEKFTHVEAAYLCFGLPPDGHYGEPSNNAPPYVKKLAAELCQYAWYKLKEENNPCFFSDAAVNAGQMGDIDIEFSKEDLRWFFMVEKELDDADFPEFLQEPAKKPGKESQQPPKSGTVTEQTYLAIIKGMLDLVLTDTDDDGKRLCLISSQNKLIAHLQDRQAGRLKGLSDGNLRKIFADANKLVP